MIYNFICRDYSIAEVTQFHIFDCNLEGFPNLVLSNLLRRGGLQFAQDKTFRVFAL